LSSNIHSNHSEHPSNLQTTTQKTLKTA